MGIDSAWCEKGMMRKLSKNALRVFREIKERAYVHCFRLAKPLGIGPIAIVSRCEQHPNDCWPSPSQQEKM